ncbi:MAG: response regulator [Firmicutes bacterium]|jgi:diguanylate cyclase (GGDEF)-like protein|nr:response regulator [Bacillota bacterium]
MNLERVLIAEYDSHLAELMVVRLSNAGYQVAVSTKGEEVLEKALEFDAGLIIVDQKLPEKDGLEVCYELRLNPRTRRVGILLLTEQMIDLKDLAKLGVRVDDQLVKPFNPREVLFKVHQVMATLRAMQTNFIPGFYGWETLRKEVQDRLQAEGSFALLFIDIKQFRIYNKYYGFSAGDEVVKWLARIIQEVTDELATPDVFLAHIQGDHFAVMLPQELGRQVGEEIIDRFDQGIPGYYREEDRERGGLVVEDREGQMITGGLMSLAVALVESGDRKFTHPLEIKEAGEEILQYIKVRPGSQLMKERRKE